MTREKTLRKKIFLKKQNNDSNNNKNEYRYDKLKLLVKVCRFQNF